LHSPEYPRIHAIVTRNDAVNDNFGSLRTTAGSTLVAAGISQGFAAFDYSVALDSALSHGTFADGNFRSNRLDVQANARPTSAIDLRVADGWIQRLPTLDDVSNPRYDGNVFNGGATWRPSTRLSLITSYADGRFAITRPTLPRTERHTQTATESLQYDLDEEWTALQAVAVSRNDDQVDTTLVRALGQSLSSGVRWVGQRGEQRYQAEAQGSVGMLEPDAGGTFLGEGGWLDFQFTQAGIERKWTGGYRISYGRNLEGREGWELQQDARGTLEAFAALGVKAELRLDASHAISRAVLFGGHETRSIRFQASATYRRTVLRALLGLSQGLIDTLPGGASPVPGIPSVPDVLKSSSVFAQASAETVLGRSGLGLRGTFNWLSTSSPGRPSLDELAFTAAAYYGLGLFTLSLEDRYAIGAVDLSSTRVNYFFARVTRAFGSQY
jgi:hypothetical protein